MKGEIELYNISFLILKVNLHFKRTNTVFNCRSQVQVFNPDNGNRCIKYAI